MGVAATTTARRTTADKEGGDDGGGGINETTTWQMRDEGSNKEGKDIKDKQAPAPLSLKKNKNQPIMSVVATER